MNINGDKFDDSINQVLLLIEDRINSFLMEVVDFNLLTGEIMLIRIMRKIISFILNKDMMNSGMIFWIVMIVSIVVELNFI